MIVLMFLTGYYYSMGLLSLNEPGGKEWENDMTVSPGATIRPIILGIVGDSAAGKTTLSRGIAQILGNAEVSVLCTDDYHRYNRQQRRALGITPLNPFSNHTTNTSWATSDRHNISSQIHF